MPIGRARYLWGVRTQLRSIAADLKCEACNGKTVSVAFALNTLRPMNLSKTDREKQRAKESMEPIGQAFKRGAAGLNCHCPFCKRVTAFTADQAIAAFGPDVTFLQLTDIARCPQCLRLVRDVVAQEIPAGRLGDCRPGKSP